MESLADYFAACVIFFMMITNLIVLDFALHIENKWQRIAICSGSVMITSLLAYLSWQFQVQMLWMALLLGIVYLIFRAVIIASKGRLEFRGVFFLYIGILLYITIFSRFHLYLPWIKISVTDMIREILSGNVRHLGLNILMFLPLGFLLPFVDRKYCQIRYLIPATVLSACIESIQLQFHIGECDIADVFGNAIGTAIGMCVFLLLTKYLPEEIYD